MARFLGPTWGPSGADRTQVAPCWPHELCYLGCFIIQTQTTDASLCSLSYYCLVGCKYYTLAHGPHTYSVYKLMFMKNQAGCELDYRYYIDVDICRLIGVRYFLKLQFVFHNNWNRWLRCLSSIVHHQSNARFSLTLYLLNFSEETKSYIFNLHHSSTLTCHRHFKSSPMWDKGLPISRSQYLDY